MSDFQKLWQVIAEKTRKEHQEQQIEAMIKVASALYDKDAAYTNLIIVAGYAGFFAVWSNMKDTLLYNEKLLSALCIIVSISVFIFLEVYVMISNSKSIHGLNNIINISPDKFPELLAKYQKEAQRLNVRTRRLWPAILIFTIVPGIIGGGVLMYSFIRQLLFCA
jgi:hypothetical protein